MIQLEYLLPDVSLVALCWANGLEASLPINFHHLGFLSASPISFFCLTSNHILTQAHNDQFFLPSDACYWHSVSRRKKDCLFIEVPYIYVDKKSQVFLHCLLAKPAYPWHTFYFTPSQRKPLSVFTFIILFSMILYYFLTFQL